VGANDTSKPLISKLLAVPALKARYLGYVRDMAEKWLDWQKLGPVGEQYHALIRELLKADMKKLTTFEEFEASLGGQSGSLKSFVDQRRTFLLAHPEVKTATLPARSN
jgi:hypothetical protein